MWTVLPRPGARGAPVLSGLISCALVLAACSSPDDELAQFLEQCTVHADCLSGECVPAPEGRVCTQACSDHADCSAGPGWQCVAAGPGGARDLCLPDLSRLCEPCATDQDCLGGAAGDRCVATDDGLHCGRSCEGAAPCPAGFVCRLVAGAGHQCLPADGLCGDCRGRDLNSDPDNCGSCDNRCVAGQSCVAGLCRCESGQVVCGERCVAPNACGGCDHFSREIGEPCGERCGRWDCEGTGWVCSGERNLESDAANCGACQLACREDESCREGVCGCPPNREECGGVCVPTGTCEGAVTCAELDCASLHRACLEGLGDEDSKCGACLPGFVAESEECVATLAAPGAVGATAGESPLHVVVSWGSVAHATGYHVYRDGARVSATPVASTTFVDAEAPEGGPPGAPPEVTASTALPEGVELGWVAAEGAPGDAASYRVRAVADAVEGPLSEAAVGHRAPWPVLGYEVSWEGAGAATPIGAALSWVDADAPLATIVAGAPEASTDMSDGVHLALDDLAAEDGAPGEYRVRAHNQAGFGPWSETATGHRAAGALSLQWQRAADEAGAYEPIAEATGSAHVDDTVVAGEAAWYRVAIDGPGAEAVVSSPVQGRVPYRCQDLGCASQDRVCEEGSGSADAVCGGCVAGTVEDGAGGCVLEELPAPAWVWASMGISPDLVEVSWDRVPEAEGYHVFRDGVRLTDAPHVGEHFLDWAAPVAGPIAAVGDLSATDDRTADVLVSWADATPQGGPAVEYQVQAVAAARESALTGPALGFTAAELLSHYEVFVDGSVDWAGGSEWIDSDAPAGAVVVGSATASQDRDDGVMVTLLEVGALPGPTRTYQVRAQGERGPGDLSEEVSGRRAVGPPVIQWQVAPHPDGPFGALAPLSSTALLDEDAPAGESRWYRAQVSAAGAETTLSGAVEGRRPVRCADLGCEGLGRGCAEGAGAVDAACGECLPGLEPAGAHCVTPLAAPENVVASQGTHWGYVLVSWDPVPGATAYHLFREGEPVTSAPMPNTSRIDAGAPLAGAPPQVTGLTASTSVPEHVALSWDVAVPLPGPFVEYRVRAVADEQDGPFSEPAVGYTAARAVTTYQMRVDGGPWTDLPTLATTSTHMAPRGAMTLALPEASTDRSDGVALAIAPATIEHGPLVTYQVRARSDAGAGEASHAATGFRPVGEPSYQWVWAATSTGMTQELEGAHALTHLDQEIPPGELRWYRMRASAAGVHNVFTPAVPGERLVETEPIVPCASDAECEGSTWCPTGTTERSCSPRPVFGGLAIPFQFIPAAGQTFLVGSPPEETGHRDSEVQVSVTLTRSIYAMRTPVTRGQWREVVIEHNHRFGTAYHTDPSFPGTPAFPGCDGDDCPVDQVSWWDGVIFANALSRLEGLVPCYGLAGCTEGDGIAAPGGGCPDAADGSPTSYCRIDDGVFVCGEVSYLGGECNGYRLPTEAEWEFAARAGDPRETYNGDLDALDCPGSVSVLDSIAWYYCNSPTRTQHVGSKAPNAWGLFDALGNVWEWTFNRFSTQHVGGTDPIGAASGGSRARRGGTFTNSYGVSARAARRLGWGASRRDKDAGLRLVRTAGAADPGEPAGLPEVATGPPGLSPLPGGHWATSIRVIGNVLDEGDFPVTAKGICWSTAPDPTFADDCTEDGSGEGPFVGAINGLTPSTHYHFRAYATNALGTEYGRDLTATTLSADPPGSVRDIDGNTYATVSFGSLVWMAENLRTTRYRDGGDVPFAPGDAEWSQPSADAHCWMGDDVANRGMYGALYTWPAATHPSGLCPEGWRVPTDDDWKDLELALGLPVEELDEVLWRGTTEGGRLKSTRTEPAVHPRWGAPNEAATDDVGLSAVPGGYRSPNGTTWDYGRSASLWTATPGSFPDSAYTRMLSFSSGTIHRAFGSIDFGRSVRCVRDP